MENVLPIGMICSVVPAHAQVSLSGTKMEQTENMMPTGMICSVVPGHAQISLSRKKKSERVTANILKQNPHM